MVFSETMNLTQMKGSISTDITDQADQRSNSTSKWQKSLEKIQTTNDFKSRLLSVNNRLSTSKTSLHSTASQVARKNERREENKKVNKIVISICVSYVVCWLPWNLKIFYSHFLPSFGLYGGIIMFVTQFLKYGNHVVNPLICMVGSEKFREEFKLMFGQLTAQSKIQ